MRITKRLSASEQRCIADQNRPAVFLTSWGYVAFTGRIGTPETRASLPTGSGVGVGEELVVVPREVLVDEGWTPPAE